MAEALQLAAVQAGCIISVSYSHQVTPETLRPLPQGPWSGSGVILTQNPGIVLCHGAIFSPFLLGAEHQDWAQCRVLLPDSFSPDIQIQVLVSGECSSKANGRNWLSGDLGDKVLELRFSPLSNRHETPSGPKRCEAELIMMVPCPHFQDAFSKVFSASDLWHFGGNEVEQESSSLADDLRFLHWFALLRILDCDFRGAGWVSCVPGKSLRKGDPLFTCGSPFGSFCPDIFMNTLSKGIVSNMAGDCNTIILTDARCLPGTEGGGVFAVSGTGLHLAGIIVAPLCWKSNEWVGLTLVCAIDCILESIGSVLTGPHQFLKGWLNPRQLMSKVHGKMVAENGPDQQMLAAVVLLECGPTWGSGVMVNSKLVLTCRHVVYGASSVYIRLQPSPEKTSSIKGKVVFSTKESSPYDVALVELEEDIPTSVEPVWASKFYAGEDVSIVSFGALGQACGPSITSGILSAVITVRDKPVMLQATCAVHGGSSGGALFATHSRQLLGIVASNTRDHSIGATYPHLNFSIPITVLQPALLDYAHTRNLGRFRELDRVDHRIQVVWRLQREPVEGLLSKL
ncbi:peroxisomal leader peptide-processing protease [Hemicordylus capensis]|uniref:peroxisomal leader peptide-processing protease n=1 Tax=Hemicordylus capensis TaxID=884348 RepID=UPI002303579A|nr:peroxisomal leader peptide-processing protease [Hemicordylus capensis]